MIVVVVLRILAVWSVSVRSGWSTRAPEDCPDLEGWHPKRQDERTVQYSKGYQGRVLWCFMRGSWVEPVDESDSGGTKFLPSKMRHLRKLVPIWGAEELVCIMGCVSSISDVGTLP